MEYRTLAELEAEMPELRHAPADGGLLQLIVRRTGRGLREVLASAQLDTTQGLVGDKWLADATKYAVGGAVDVENQITVMSTRTIAAISPDESRRPLAGDQLYVDLDLSVENLPPGSRLAIGDAILEISVTPHTGCRSFAARYGTDAVKFVNSPEGKHLRLRGLNAKVVQSGVVRPGDLARKL